MESPRTGRPVANQFIIADDHRMIFQSYDSMIVDIDFFNSTITFGKNWNYSTTTAKYRNQFLDMYFSSLANTKKLKMLEQIVRGCGGQTEYQVGAFIYTIKFE
jgi:hypothetical protein